MDNDQGNTRPVIAYIGGFRLPDQNAAANRVQAVADLFNECGYDTGIVGVEMNAQRSPNDFQVRDLPACGPHVRAWDVGYPRSSKEWFGRIISCQNILDHLEETYGSRLAGVIFYNFPAVAQDRARRWAKQRALPCIADVTEWYEDDPWNSLRGVFKNLDTRYRMRVVNPRMSALITTSPYLTRYYRRAGHAELELPTLLPRDLDFAAHKRVAPRAVPHLFFAGSGFDAKAYAGAPEMLKDRLDWCLTLLAQAHRESIGFHYDIFGTTQEDFTTICPDLRSSVAEMVDAGHVVFHGRRPRAEVLSKLWDADYAFFMRESKLSTEAGFPTKLSEPLMHGIPVLSNPMENVTPYIRSGETGDLIDKDAPDSGYASLRTALTRSPAARHQMHDICMSEQPFAADGFIKATEQFLQTVLNSQKGA